MKFNKNEESLLKEEWINNIKYMSPRPRYNRKKILCLILLCFMSLGFIFFNSSQTGNISNQRSNGIVNEIVTIIQESDFNNSLKVKYNKQELNLVVRKFAHGFEFSLLSIISYLALTSFGVKGKRSIVYTLFIVLSCATLDELFQLRIPGRNSSAVDVLIDFSGGIVGVCFIKYLTKKVESQVPQKMNCKSLLMNVDNKTIK